MFDRHAVNLLAVSRKGRRITHRLRGVKLRAGDVVVFRGNLAAMPETLGELHCLPLAERDLRIGRKAVYFRLRCWQRPHLTMLRSADVALILGGGPEHTYGAGLAAALLGVRVMPIPYFGGAGEALRAELDGPLNNQNMRRPSSETWQAMSSDLYTCSNAILSELRSLPRIMVVHGHIDDRVLVADPLRRLGVDSVVLRDLSNVGWT